MLTGTSVTYAVTNHQDGGVLFDPIPGDAIRQMYTIPQVRKPYSYASGMLNCGFPGEEGGLGQIFSHPLVGLYHNILFSTTGSHFVPYLCAAIYSQVPAYASPKLGQCNPLFVQNCTLKANVPLLSRYYLPKS